MKIIKICFCFLLLISALLVTGCENGGSKNGEIFGFDVLEQETAELGSTYSVNIPLVYDEDGKTYDIDTQASYNGESVELSGGILELEHVGDYKIDFTIEVGGETIKKTTTVTVVDTIGPAISFGDLTVSGKIGDKIDLNKIVASDYSGIKDCITEVYKDGEPVAVSDNSFVLADRGYYEIKVKATDNNDKESEEEYTIEALPENWIYSFNTGYSVTEFGTRKEYANVYQVEDAPGADGGCLKIEPSRNWFYITWENIGTGDKYEYDLSDEKWYDYAYVVFDIYFETASEGAIVYDFKKAIKDSNDPNKIEDPDNYKDVGTSVALNKWVTVYMMKEYFNNETERLAEPYAYNYYMALWSNETPTAVYIDNVRLEKVSSVKYDFEKGDNSLEFDSNQGKTSLAKDPVNSENNVLLYQANAVWAALNFNKFNVEQLKEHYYDEYTKFVFKIYVKTTENRENMTVKVFGISYPTIKTNEWVEISISIDEIRANGEGKQLVLWPLDEGGCSVYIDDIGVSGRRGAGTDDSSDIKWITDGEL